MCLFDWVTWHVVTDWITGRAKVKELLLKMHHHHNNVYYRPMAIGGNLVGTNLCRAWASPFVSFEIRLWVCMVIHKLHKSMRGNYASASSSSVTCECLGVERSTPSTTGKQRLPVRHRWPTFGPTGRVIIMQLEWMAYSGHHWRQRVAESADFGHVSQHRHWTFTWPGLRWSLVLSGQTVCLSHTLRLCKWN